MKMAWNVFRMIQPQYQFQVSQLFKDAENTIKNKTKFNEVIQKLSNGIAVATVFYKPRLGDELLMINDC